MERDAELLLDQTGDAGGRPEVGEEAEVGGRPPQPAEDFDLLLGRQERLAAGVGRSGEGVVAELAAGADPTADGLDVEVEEGGDVGGRPAFVDLADGAASAFFPIGAGAFNFHDEDRLRRPSRKAVPRTCESVGLLRKVVVSQFFRSRHGNAAVGFKKKYRSPST